MSFVLSYPAVLYAFMDATVQYCKGNRHDVGNSWTMLEKINSFSEDENQD